MKVLFVTTHPPFPPIDGVRIPEAHHLIALNKEHHVDCLILKCDDFKYDESDLEETRKHVVKLFELKLKNINKMYALFRELVFQEPYYGRWVLREGDLFSLVDENYDLVWCGTPPAVALGAQPWFRKRTGGTYHVAGLSDMHSLVMIKKSQEETEIRPGLRKFIEGKLIYIHGVLLKTAETEMLKKYTMCTMQTRTEADWLLSMRNAVPKERICILPNGVNSELFELPIERKGRHIFFVGLVSGEYHKRMIWFFDNSWNEIRGKYPELKCSVIGKGATPEFVKYLEDRGVSYTPYVESLKDVYKDKAILIAPIFKGYGIINKVLEAMAAGCLVVGDKTAFSGIDGFRSGEHGLVAETAFEFTKQIIRGLESVDCLKDVRQKGRELVKVHFDWQDRYAKILERIRMFN